MDKKTVRLYYLPFFILLLTFNSVNQWSKMPIGSTLTEWIVIVLTIGSMVLVAKDTFDTSHKKNYIFVYAFFAWMAIGVVRGYYEAHGYWMWKQFINNTMCLLPPIAVFTFYEPVVLERTLKAWMPWALAAFVVFFYWQVGLMQFYFGPIFLLACFIPLIPRQWKFIVGALIVWLLLNDYINDRAQSIKALSCILISLACLFHRFIPTFLLKVVHWAFYIAAITLLYLGITERYNIFEETATENEGVVVSQYTEDGEWVEVDLASDTRTFIYTEVIGSAIENNYVWTGRTLARGNDSTFFGDENYELTGLYERAKNELCFPNVFTWLGVIGMVLYCLIYLGASFLAVYRSNSIYVRLLGVVVAFHFLFGWIEDITRFDILNLSLWMTIAICYSARYRSMTDDEFKQWIRNIFTYKRFF